MSSGAGLRVRRAGCRCGLAGGSRSAVSRNPGACGSSSVVGCHLTAVPVPGSHRQPVRPGGWLSVALASRFRWSAGSRCARRPGGSGSPEPLLAGSGIGSGFCPAASLVTRRVVRAAPLAFVGRPVARFPVPAAGRFWFRRPAGSGSGRTGRFRFRRPAGSGRRPVPAPGRSWFRCSATACLLSGRPTLLGRPVILAPHGNTEFRTEGGGILRLPQCAGGVPHVAGGDAAQTRTCGGEGTRTCGEERNCLSPPLTGAGAC